MGIWEKPGQEDSRMLAELRQIANGYDHMGNRVSQQAQQAAIAQYQQIQELKGRRFIDECRREDDAKLTSARAEAELRRVKVEEDRLKLEAIQARDRLQLETIQVVERLQIEKADVLVRALQVAVNGGIDPVQLLSVIQGLGERLLPGPAGSTPLMQLEDKKKGS